MKNFKDIIELGRLVRRYTKRLSKGGIVMVFEEYSKGATKMYPANKAQTAEYELEEMRRRFDEFDDVPY